jgi:hypothetical protein
LILCIYDYPKSWQEEVCFVLTWKYFCWNDVLCHWKEATLWISWDSRSFFIGKDGANIKEGNFIYLFIFWDFQYFFGYYFSLGYPSQNI